MVKNLNRNYQSTWLSFPVRSWQDWLRPKKFTHNNTWPYTKEEISQIHLKLSLPKSKSGMKCVRAALSYELETSKRLQGAHTLTRSKIKTSKSKLWRQKGTGRARAGSKSSPLWKGGGVVFGPNHDKFTKSRNVNKKIWKKAIEFIFYNKKGSIIVIEGPWNSAGTPSAKFHDGYEKFLRLMKAQQAHYLLITPSHVSLKSCRRELDKATTNQENWSNALNIVSFSTLKCVDLLRADYIIIVV